MRPEGSNFLAQHDTTCRVACLALVLVHEKAIAMLHLMVLLACLAMSQWIADRFKEALPPSEISSWCWAFLLQYVICVLILVFLDNVPLREAISPAIGVTWLIRAVYLFKRRSKQ